MWGINMKTETKTEIYCPYCNRTIEANNTKEFHLKIHDELLWVHDEVYHPKDCDFKAMENGIH
jgi:glutaredoxin